MEIRKQHLLAKQIAECVRKRGDAHDAHMDVNDECPWCGMTRKRQDKIHPSVIGQAVRRATFP